jgi:tRNA(Ile)-lysidine synthase
LKKLVIRKQDELHIPVLKLIKNASAETLLFELLYPYGFSSAQISQVMQLVHSETGRQVLSERYRVIKNRNWLIVTTIASENALHVIIERNDAQCVFLDGTLNLIQMGKSDIRVKENNGAMIPADSAAHVAYLDARKLRYPLIVRRWKTGDYFYPLGMKKKKKIARFMIDSKMSKPEKESAWVLESDHKIVWFIGRRIDDRFKLTDDSGTILKISYQAK